MSLAIPIVVFIVFALIAAWIGASVVSARRPRQRLERLSRTQPVAHARRPEGPTDQLPTVTKIMSSKGFTEKLMLEISRAGLKMRPSEFAVGTAALVITLMFVGLLLHQAIWWIVVLGLIGYAIPLTYLKARQQIRLTAFNAQIADALTLMASSLRSGYGFLRAMQVVAAEMPPPISEEFGRVINECNVGVPTEDALGNLVARINSYDIDMVVTAVIIQMQLGGNLAEILDTIAETIRERVRINGEVATLTAEGRLSGIILIALPILLGLAISALNPSYMAPLLHEHVGKILMLVGGILMILGALVIRRMLQVDF